MLKLTFHKSANFVFAFGETLSEFGAQLKTPIKSNHLRAEKRNARSGERRMRGILILIFNSFENESRSRPQRC